jgi:TRAP-type C4-dicarboxylate transport system permease small subunit
MLERLLGVAGRIAQLGVWVGGTLLILASVVITVDVVARKAFGVTLGGSDELSGYCLAISAAWAFAFALLHRANIRVDAAYKYFPVRVRAALDVVALIALAVFVAVVARYGFEVFMASIRFASRANTPLQTPLWIPQGLWFAGLAFFLVTLFLVTLKAVVAFTRGRFAEVDRLAGLPDVAREAEEEVAALEQRLAKAGRQSGS